MRNSMYKAELVGAACKGRKAWGPLCEGWRRSQIALQRNPASLYRFQIRITILTALTFTSRFAGRKPWGTILSLLFSA